MIKERTASINMYLHFYITRLKCLYFQFNKFVWIFGLPVLLAILYNIGIHNSLSGAYNEAISIAVVGATKGDNAFTNYLESIEVRQSKYQFDITYTDKNHAIDLLKEIKLRDIFNVMLIQCLSFLRMGYHNQSSNPIWRIS